MTTRDNSARTALIRIVCDHGSALGEDARRCEALLRDFCPNARPEIHLFVIAARAGVPKQLMTSSSGSARELLEARLARTLQDDFAVTPEAAHWAIESWAQALGAAVMITPTNPHPSAQRPTVVAKSASPSQPRPTDRFVANGDGTVTDAQTGLIWADRDNGKNISWKDAGMYCTTMGSDWQLPTVTQLQGLLDASRELKQSVDRYTCHASPMIHLSSRWHWSSDEATNGASEAWCVGLDDGSRYLLPVAHANGRRVLCVRRCRAPATACDDSVRAALVSMISYYGRVFDEDPRRCEALLRDFCPNARAEIHLLVVAARSGVPKQLGSSSVGSSRELLVARLARTLEEEFSITAAAARWAVESWAQALGVVGMTLPTNFGADPQAPAVASANPPPRHQSMAPKFPPPSSAVACRFVANSNSTVTDTQTGLTWANRDNGHGVSWTDAETFVATKGSDWQLPTVAQLQSLVDSSGGQTQKVDRYTCNVTPLICLSGWWFWSSEANGTSEAWAVVLTDGYRVSVDVAYANGRVLCVRRS